MSNKGHRWIELTRDGDQWHTLVLAVLKLRVLFFGLSQTQILKSYSQQWNYTCYLISGVFSVVELSPRTDA